MAKFDVKFKDAVVYFSIVGIVAGIFLLGSYLIVDKFTLSTALLYRTVTESKKNNLYVK